MYLKEVFHIIMQCISPALYHPPRLPFHSQSPSNLRRVAIGTAKLEDQVGIGALIENSVLATRVAGRVSVRAVTGGARRARNAETVASAASEELEALGLKRVAEDGGQVVVGSVGVGADVVDGLQRAAEVGPARDGEGGLLHV
jgi:hypothetical protein